MLSRIKHGSLSAGSRALGCISPSCGSRKSCLRTRRGISQEGKQRETLHRKTPSGPMTQRDSKASPSKHPLYVSEDGGYGRRTPIAQPARTCKVCAIQNGNLPSASIAADSPRPELPHPYRGGVAHPSSIHAEFDTVEQMLV